jgi:enoyl-CoA hydratase/carnithine racemase
MAYEEIHYAVADRIATITLNRPDRLNAWTPVMAEEVRDAMQSAAENSAVRVIVLTGAGRGFCPGADMAELQHGVEHGVPILPETCTAEQIVSALTGTKTVEELEGEGASSLRSDFRKRYSYFPAIPKPIIAAINGPAAGLGLILALHCDLRFASEKARFSTAFSRRGLVAEHGIAWMLPRIVGLSNALDLLFSARLIDAQEALRMGLVNRVFPEAGLMEGVLAYTRELATTVSPRSLGVIKKQVYEAQFQTFAEASKAADEEMVLSIQSEDFKEGVAHFIEKRAPAFTGK